MITPWHVFTLVAMACGAVVPGPCSFVPDSRWDCSLGDACPEGFACAADGFCKSADIACNDGETLCSYPSLERVGICVDDGAFQTDAAHCGGCFERCRGGAACVDGACVDEIAEGECRTSRGHFDCAGGQVCAGDADIGQCETAAAAGARLFEACGNGGDCEGGLCASGVCTRPCDIGCPAFSTCDDDAIPGGLCVPLPDDQRCQ